MPGVPVVDMVRLLKMIYCCLIPGTVASESTLDLNVNDLRMPCLIDEHDVRWP